MLATYLKGLSPTAVLALGPVPTRGDDVTVKPDLLKGRGGDTSFLVPRPFTVHAEKCPNRRGVEMVLDHFQGEVVSFDALSRRVVAGEFAALYIASDAIEPWINEEAAHSLRTGVQFLVIQDTTVTPLAQLADVVLAGATFAEKAGCYVNADGRLQYAEASLPPRDGSLPDLDLFAILLGRVAGPVRSSDVLAEVATVIPAFAVAAGGRVAEFGVPLDESATVGARVAFPFADAWTQPRGETGDRPGAATPKGGKNA